MSQEISHTPSRLFAVFMALLMVVHAYGAGAADQPALSVLGLGPTGNDYYQGASYCTGWRFTANKDVIVTSLGYYDDKKDGITGNHDVGIYDVVSKQLLAMTTVVPTDPLTGFFRYHALTTPVTLTSGKDYYIQGVTLSDRYAIFGPIISVDPAITFKGNAGDSGNVASSTLHYPNPGEVLSSTNISTFGPSMLISNPGLPTANSAAGIDFADLGFGSDASQSALSLGFHFVANQDFQIQTLGYYDDAKNGLLQAHTVTIFDAMTKAVVATANVASSDPMRGFFHYKTITPVTLKAGAEYHIMADNATDKYAQNLSSPTINSLITLKGGAFNSAAPAAGPDFPTEIDRKAPFYGPNFEVTKGAAGPLSVSFTADSPVALLGRPVSFSLLATGGTAGAAFPYSVDFGDGSAVVTGTVSAGAPAILMHTYNAAGDYMAKSTVTDAGTVVSTPFGVSVPVPSSAGTGVPNVSNGAAPVENPLNGISMSVAASNGGVLELVVSINSLVRDVFDADTEFRDIPGRSTFVAGFRPVHLFGKSGIYIAKTAGMNRTTNTSIGSMRKSLIISAKETGDSYPQNVPGKTGVTAKLGDAPSSAITLKSLSGKFIFDGSKSDDVKFSGSIKLPTGLNPAQTHAFSLAVGNVVVDATLDEKGKGKALDPASGLKSLKVAYSKVKKGTLTTGGELAQISFAISAPKLVAAGFDTEGISSTATDVTPQKSATRKIQVGLLLDGVPYDGLMAVDFSLSKDKAVGSIKGPAKN